MTHRKYEIAVIALLIASGCQANEPRPDAPVVGEQPDVSVTEAAPKKHGELLRLDTKKTINGTGVIWASTRGEFREGDIIMWVAGFRTESPEDLRQAFEAHPSGAVRVLLTRKGDGSAPTTNVELWLDLRTVDPTSDNESSEGGE